MRNDSIAMEAFRTSEAGLINGDASISMAVLERVVFDYVSPGELSPPPSILNPESLEVAIDRQGYRVWELKPSADSVTVST
jgi:hypothetical protein